MYRRDQPRLNNKKTMTNNLLINNFKHLTTTPENVGQL